MRIQIFHSPGNEVAELAKIPGDGDPPPPHWNRYLQKHEIEPNIYSIRTSFQIITYSFDALGNLI